MPATIHTLGELRKAKQTRDAANTSVAKVMVMADQPTPRETFILTRGDYSKKEGKVAPATPSEEVASAVSRGGALVAA